MKEWTYESIQFKQPFWVMANTHYYKHSVMKYGIDHFYSFVTDGEKETMISVPDGCVDISFCCDSSNPHVRLLGSVTTGMPSIRPKGVRYFGVRLLPGYYKTLGKISLGELRMGGVLLRDVMADASELDGIFSMQDFAKQTDYFMQKFSYGALGKAMGLHDNELFYQVLNCIIDSRGKVGMKDLVELTNYSERRIRGVFSEQMGMSVKTFSEIVRFQSLLGSMNDLQDNSKTLSELAIDSGYYDQVHMTKEFKKNCLSSPKKYLSKIRELHYAELINQI